MFEIKFNKKILNHIIILLFCVYMSNPTLFYLSNIKISTDSSTIKNPDTLVHLPEPFHYICLHSATAFLPEEETKIAMKSFNHYTGVKPNYLFNGLNTIAPWIGSKLFTFLVLSSLKRIQNTNTSNAIPLGGHAPPNYNYILNLKSIS